MALIDKCCDNNDHLSVVLADVLCLLLVNLILQSDLFLTMIREAKIEKTLDRFLSLVFCSQRDMSKMYVVQLADLIFQNINHDTVGYE